MLKLLDFGFHFLVLFLMHRFRTAKKGPKKYPLAELLFRSASGGLWPRNAANCNTKTSFAIHDMSENNSEKS